MILLKEFTIFDVDIKIRIQENPNVGSKSYPRWWWPDWFLFSGVARHWWLPIAPTSGIVNTYCIDIYSSNVSSFQKGWTLFGWIFLVAHVDANDVIGTDDDWFQCGSRCFQFNFCRNYRFSFQHDLSHQNSSPFSTTVASVIYTLIHSTHYIQQTTPIFQEIIVITFFNCSSRYTRKNNLNFYL